MAPVDNSKPFVFKKKRFYSFWKRAFDLLASGLGLILLFLPFLIVAIIIKCDDHGPVFFKQERVGKDGRLFKMYKFRSMRVGAEAEVETLKEQNEDDGPRFKIKDDPRITKVGKFLRKSSIDELPQLLNVFSGSMSLVGPRPALPKEVAEYDELAKRRLYVKPGITCIWQVSGRSNVSFAEQMKMDAQYVETRSLWLDLKLLFMTIPAVLKGDGAE